MKEALILLGIALIFIGMLIIIAASMKDAKIESAGGIFIGPIPIFGFFTSKKAFYALLAIAILIFIVYIILRLMRIV